MSQRKRYDFFQTENGIVLIVGGRANRMVIFEKWWHKGNKVFCVGYYKSWKKPEFKIFTNGAKRKNGDSCYDFNIHFGRFAFWYTNYDLQRTIKR